MYCLISNFIKLDQENPNRCVWTHQVGLREKLVFNEEFNDIKQHLARKNNLPGQEVMHRGNQQAFFPFWNFTVVTFNNATH